MNRTLYKIEKNSRDVVNSILTNIIKMLTNRGLLAESDLDKNIKNLLDNIAENMIYVIKLNNNKKLALIIVPHKITAVHKSYGANEFLEKYGKHRKIVVVRDIAKKAKQYITTNYPGTEIFLEDELMFNLVDHHLIPKHILLTKEEGKKVKSEYNLTNKNAPKILHTDPVARYYNMQIGDICKILRPSDKAGTTPSYRLVIKGEITK